VTAINGTTSWLYRLGDDGYAWALRQVKNS
jgi:hypothetical protein